MSNLDQLAVSNLIKTTLPEHRHKFDADNAATHFGYWPRLLESLDRLVHLNLLVCPRSSVHEHEAAFDSRLSGPLRSFHAQLAGDVDLEDHETVKRFQLELRFKAWLGDCKPEHLERQDVVRGHPNAWLDRFMVNAHYPVSPGEIAALRAHRDEVDENLQAMVSDWRQQSDRSFEEFFDEQLAAYGPACKNAPSLSDLMISLRAQLDDESVPPDQWSTAIEAFLESDAPSETPFAQIAGGLLAAMAWRASRNQLGRPTRGLRADLQAIATYMPYVDAMFVDNECARLLREAPLAGRLSFGTLIFSPDSREEFIEWLRRLEGRAPAGHVNLVGSVYGDAWLMPRDAGTSSDS